jgi:hypothetical protein
MDSMYPLYFIQLSNKYPAVPSPVHGDWNGLLKDLLMPTFIKLSSIVREIVGKKSTDQKVELCAMSIIGQYLYFRNAKPIIFRLRHKEAYSNEDIKEIADHIIIFSLQALNNYFKKEIQWV